MTVRLRLGWNFDGLDAIRVARAIRCMFSGKQEVFGDMATDFVNLIDAVSGLGITVNVQQIRYLSQFDPQTVRIHFEKDHILPVKGVMSGIVSLIEKPEK